MAWSPPGGARAEKEGCPSTPVVLIPPQATVGSGFEPTQHPTLPPATLRPTLTLPSPAGGGFWSEVHSEEEETEELTLRVDVATWGAIPSAC